MSLETQQQQQKYKIIKGINLEALLEAGACIEGIKWFTKDCYPYGVYTQDSAFTLKGFLEKVKAQDSSWITWLLDKGFIKEQRDNTIDPCPCCGSSTAPRYMKAGDDGAAYVTKDDSFIICSGSEGGCGTRSGYLHQSGFRIGNGIWNRRSSNAPK